TSLVHHWILCSEWVSAMHANCHFLYELQMAEKECLGMLADELPPHTKGCQGMWDNISCWHHADIGEVVVNTCPAALKNLFSRDGIISRNCTMEGWSDVYPSVHSACFEPTPNASKVNLKFLILRNDIKSFSLPFCVLQLNFILFISIIRILVQKLRCPDVGGNDQSQYRRLAKSTLLLIPLFGINYVVFVYIIEENGEMENYKIFFDLGLGSFQVRICLNVQSELKRKWRSLRLKRYIGRDYRLHSSSISRNGTENMAQFHRNSRAQSFLQTETTVV
uniref:Vasoactive intestinal peptide receptor 2 n=1 Tax=Sinocyclocheilus grahami TaxID=75366 RepID=A0A672MB95_SINGR